MLTNLDLWHRTVITNGGLLRPDGTCSSDCMGHWWCGMCGYESHMYGNEDQAIEPLMEHMTPENCVVLARMFDAGG